MKKISLLFLTLMALLFTQCKPEPEPENNEDMVRVSCVLSLNNETRSDFTNVLDDGKINWSDGEEYIYLAIPGDNPTIVEMEGYSEGYKAIEFSAYVNANLINEGTSYEIWYLGNSKTLNTPYYNLINNNRIEGSIATQSGRLSDLGYCHVASTTVTAVMENGEVKLPVSGILRNKMSIALLDLNNITSLSGSAICGTSYSLEYNSTSEKYEFTVEQDADARIDVESAAGISYVILFPNENNNVVLQCERNAKNCEYVFKNGLKANKLYYRAEQNGDVSCLPWTEYKDNSGEDGGDEGGNEEIIDGKVRLFAKGVTLTSGWYDVNKIDYTTDINMCWAATSSNIIQWWQDRYMAAGNELPEGAISGKGTTYELALMEIYKEQWDNSRGADASHGITWYFEGRNIQQYATAGSYAQPLSGNNGGYFANIWNEILPYVYHDYSYVIIPGTIEFNNLITTEYNGYNEWGNGSGLSDPERLARFSELLVEFMERGTCGLGVSVGLGGGLHSITLWGCEYDNATGIVSKIWIADSDDIKSGPRTPILHECTISMEGGSIRIDGASQTYYIKQLFPVSGYGSL